MDMSRFQHLVRFPLFFLSLLSGVLVAEAQSGDAGIFEGIVNDGSGGVVTQVQLYARNLHTLSIYTTTTDENGLFFFPFLPVGIYELTAEHAGFAGFVQKNIEVNVGGQVSLAITLRIASQSESLVVRDETPLLETTRSSVRSVVSDRSISNLPANGRNFLDFVLLTPAVTPGSRGFDASFAGQRKMNLLRVDGADNDNTYFGEALGSSGSGFAPYQLSLATVGEFQVSTNTYSAEHGRVGAGAIDVVTKSGTNDFQGQAFGYYRDRSMNATDLLTKISGQPKSPYHFNQFGAAVGGPILRNRLFFFAAYDAQRSKQQNLVRLNLPFGFQFDPDPVKAAFQLRALDYLQRRTSSWLRSFDQDVYFAKADWHIGKAHVLTGRWNRQRFFGAGLESQGNQISFEHTGASLSDTDTVAISLATIFSPSLANTLLVSYVRSREPGFANSPNPEASVFQDGQLVLTVGRNPQSPREQDINRLQWSDTFSYLLGKHAFKFGAEVLPNWIRAFSTVDFSGSSTFRSLENFGRSLSGAPMAQPGESYVQSFSGSGTPGSVDHPDFVEYGGFIQDEWRLRPHWTLNLGARYDLQVIAKPTIRNPSPALAAAGIDTSFLRTEEDDFAPRVGFAWAPLSAGRFVVRGGYGIYVWRTPSIITSKALAQNGVSVQTVTIFGGRANAGFIPSYPNTLCGPPDATGISPSCAAPTALTGNQILLLFARDYTQPYAQHGSLGIEAALSKDCSVSSSYLAVKGTHLQRFRDINLSPPAPATIAVAGTSTVLTYQRFPSVRPISGFDRILLMESSASSIYHALALQADRRFSHNFQFIGSYTFSKVIDDNPEPIAVNPPGSDNLLLSDPWDPRADRGLGANDQRHRFVAAAMWQSRASRTFHSPLGRILGDWQFSGILTAQTGLPYSGLVNFDLNNDGNRKNDRTPEQGRNTFHMPTRVSFDPRVERSARFSEHVQLQLLWEAFDVLNHGNITGVNTTQYAASVCGSPPSPCALVPLNNGPSAFGAPASTSGPRIMQLAAKLLF